MTKNAKTAAAAGAALFSSFAMMALLRAYGPPHSAMPDSGFHGSHSMTAMWSQMGWIMPLGPISMMLFFGSVLTLVVLFVRYLTKPD